MQYLPGGEVRNRSGDRDGDGEAPDRWRNLGAQAGDLVVEEGGVHGGTTGDGRSPDVQTPLVPDEVAVRATEGGLGGEGGAGDGRIGRVHRHEETVARSSRRSQVGVSH